MRTRASSAKISPPHWASAGQPELGEAALLDRIAELEEFAQFAAHDLIQPLRTVTGYLQLALRRSESAGMDPQVREWLSLAADGAVRAQDLVESALIAARDPGADTRSITSSAEAVSASLANLSQAVERSQANIRLGNLPPVLAEPVPLARVFQNLIDNAIRHGGPAPPEISVEGEDRANDWLFRVADRGQGFTGQPVPGLGLQICARVAARHGGRLWAAPAEPGSVFCFTLSKV